MISLDLSKYGPIISDKQTGEEIFDLINGHLSNDQKVSIKLDGIRSMATFCAKQIFGRIYLTYGSEAFFDKIQLKGASDDLKMIIKIGIQSALDEK